MKKPTVQSLKNKLNKVFAEYIRKRDTDPESGKGWCITCGTFTELECGHFIPRQHSATRWLENNSHGQCSRCNRWLHGDQAAYYEALVQKYGQDVVSELMRLKKTTKKYSMGELQEMIGKYQES